MIKLHQFAPAWGLNPSPFCLKIEIYLKLTKRPFEVVVTVPFRAPKGKLPYITDGERTIADSGQIIAYLKKTYGDPLDHALTAEQQALGHVIRRTCEESLLFAALYSRWLDEPGWSAVRQAFFVGLPKLVAPAIAAMIRRGIRRSLHGQGYGRHHKDEIYALGCADLQAIATLLGDRSFIVADHPTSFDATLYGFLVNMLRVPIDTPLNRYALSVPSFHAYLERMDMVLENSV